mgnify:CR=1 FL=1
MKTSLFPIGDMARLFHLSVSSIRHYDVAFLLLDDADHFEGALLELPETLCVRIRFHGHHLQAPA